MTAAATCPRCRRELSAITQAAVISMVCPSCRGVALRGADLRRHFGPAAQLVSEAPSTYAPGDPTLDCPAGCGPMRRRAVHAAGSVLFDTCPWCSTTWFDRGEVAAIVAIARGRAAERRHPDGQRWKPPDPIADARHELLLLEVQQSTSADSSGARDSVPWWLFALLTGLPVEGYNPLFRFPAVTWALMVACVTVYGAEVVYGPALLLRWALVPSELRLAPVAVSHLFSLMFLHSGVAHLLGNLYFLKVFGDNVEDRLGRAAFLAFYLLAGVTATLTYTVATTRPDLPLVGASGAISGCLGAYLVFFPDVRISVVPGVISLFRWLHLRALWYLPFWVLWQFACSKLFGGNIAWWAHIGGFLAGVAIASIARSLVPDARTASIVRRKRAV